MPSATEELNVLGLSQIEDQKVFTEKLAELHQSIDDFVTRRRGNSSLILNLNDDSLTELLSLVDGQWMKTPLRYDLVSVVQKILQNCSASNVITKQHNALQEMLTADNEDIAAMVLTVLCYYSSNDDDGLKAVVEMKSLLQCALKSIASKHLSIVRLHGDLVSNITAVYDHQHGFFQNDVIAIFQHLLAHSSSVVRFRVYDLFVTVYERRSHLFAFCRDSGIFDNLLQELDSQDVLAQLNSIELLARIATTDGNEGLHYLEEKSALKQFDNIIEEVVNGNALLRILLPGVIKFFGALATSNPECLHKYPRFLFMLFLIVDERDMSLVPLAFETLFLVASSDKGLSLLQNTSKQQLCHAMTACGDCIKNNSDETIRCRLLRAFAVLLNSRQDSDSSSNTYPIIHEMYSNLDNDPMKLLLSLARQPFPQLKHEALCVMLSLTRYAWAVRHMAECAGLVEYLLDRSAEPDRACKETKHAIVKSLSMSSTAQACFSKDHVEALVRYANEGAFFVTSQAAVQLDDATD